MSQTQKSRSTKSQNRPAKSSKKKLPLFKRIFIWLASIIGIVTIIGILIVAFFIATVPDVKEDDLRGTIPSVIYDKNGAIVTTLGGNERKLIEPTAIPKNVEDAVLSIEDRRFYDHNGVDLFRIGGALLANISSGSIAQGGSTITQQLIKLSAFSTSEVDQNIKRKIQEAWIALQLERNYNKQDILAFYLNKVYLSNNVYGFGTAAQYYYDKDIAQLTVPEAAMLAGMIQAPSAFNPYLAPEETATRRNIVLQAMVANGKITQAEYEQYAAVPITQGLIDHVSNKTERELAVDSYVQVVLEELKTKTTLDPYADGLAIYTNLDMAAQEKLLDILNTTNYIQWTNPNVQAAVTVTDPNSGALIAMVGGRNIKAQLGLNRATSTTRNVGSTSKPLVDYGPAFEYLNYHTGQPLTDSPIKYSDGTTLHNWDLKYMGNITLRTALAASRNTPALRTLREVGFDNALAFLEKLNITVMNDNQKALVESNAIGFNASPLQMGAAYGAFANGGTYYKPFTINKIVAQTGDSVSYSGSGTRVMKDSTAFMITDILKGVPRQYGQFAQINGIHHAGKTGTTNYADDQLQKVTGGKRVDFAAPDAWYIGYTPNYVIATWVGYDKPLDPGNYLDRNESYYPQHIYRHLMSYLASTVQNKDWTMPSSLERYGSEFYVKGTKPVLPVTTTQEVRTIIEENIIEGRIRTTTEKEETNEDTSKTTEDRITTEDMTLDSNTEEITLEQSVRVIDTTEIQTVRVIQTTKAPITQSIAPQPVRPESSVSSQNND